MKVNFRHKAIIIFFPLLCITACSVNAQDSVASTTTLSLRYFLAANKVPYLSVVVKKKTGRKFEVLKDIPVSVYFDEATAINLLGKTITDATGEGRVGLPASFKPTWDSLNEFKFLASSDPVAGTEQLTADASIKKAILVVDTTSIDGVRTVTAQLKEKKGSEWVAVKGVEMKLGIKRLLSNLSVGDAETYTSDSTGTASAEFKKDTMPGDEKGNIILVAKVEDNDSFGNLVVERSIPWGRSFKAEGGFWRRTLWSTGNRAPLWLLALALTILAGVWGTVIYLVRQVARIRKMGKQANFTEAMT